MDALERRGSAFEAEARLRRRERDAHVRDVRAAKDDDAIAHVGREQRRSEGARTGAGTGAARRR
jgi:hypothetical protein